MRLFPDLPVFPAALPADELALLATLKGCEWPSVQEVDADQHAAARRLAAKGLVKISRQKDDPVAIWPTWYVGKLPASGLREVAPA